MIVQYLVIAAIGLVCGIAIYIAFVRIPTKVQGIEKTLELAGMLPGRNCGACGYPGCFGLAQALTANPDLIRRSPCALMAQDAARMKALGEAIGVSLDPAALTKKAMIHCTGNSAVTYDYAGAQTCKGAAQLLSGNRKCPYACLGLGDCVSVCPENAISIDQEKHIAVIDWNKCIGCGLCVAECAKGIIELVDSKSKIAFQCSYLPLRDITGRERCDFGCTHCQRCFKACESEAIIWNKEKGIPEFDRDKCILCMKCIEECPVHCLAVTVKKEEAVAA